MIEIPKIELEKHLVFFNGQPLGWVNEYELYALQLEILKKQVSGYYLFFEGKRINIDKDGYLEDWPYGLFEFITDTLKEISKLRRETNENRASQD